MKRKSGFKFLSLLGLVLTSCSLFPTQEKIGVEIVIVKGSENEIFVDENLQLSATVYPSNADNKALTWKSTNNSVASVDQKGYVTGIGEGSTIIQAISKDNPAVKGTFELSVIEPVLESVRLKSQPTKLIYTVNDTFDPSGLSIFIDMSDGKTRTIDYNTHKSDFTFSPSLSYQLQTSDKKVTFSYVGESIDLDIIVREPGYIEKTKLTYTYDDYFTNNYINEYYGDMDNCPTKGNPKLLIIPIWFKDSDTFINESKKDNVREDIEKAYLGTTLETGWNSVKSFYETESFGKITLDATITDWYNVNESYTAYGPSTTGGSKTTTLVTKASDAYFTNHPSDSRKNYDSNRDGFLDGVMLIYAAPEYGSLGNESYSNLWAYCSWLFSSKNYTNPKANAFFWASYDFMYGLNASTRAGSHYANGSSDHGIIVDAHCFIHEMGHVFGLEDYYDYSRQYEPSGGFSMQDMNVGGHDPYSVMAYGWADPYIPSETITITIGDFQSTHDMILLANHGVTNSPFDEYLLLEYYTPTGLNALDAAYPYKGAYPSGSIEPGIRLWHVDARLFSVSPSISNLTTVPENKVYHAFSNSYDGNNASFLGSEYYEYNILQLIRNNTTMSYKPTGSFDETSIFKVGDTFNMSKYASQFKNSGKLNDNNNLGWSFKVDSLSIAGATITLTKA